MKSPSPINTADKYDNDDPDELELRYKPSTVASKCTRKKDGEVDNAVYLRMVLFSENKKKNPPPIHFELLYVVTLTVLYSTLNLKFRRC